MKQEVCEIKGIDGQMVYDSFSRTADSVGAMNGWRPKEMALLSRKVCEHVATMLKQIEEGAPWPRSAMHAKVALLEKEGTAIVEVMSYRPLTTIAPLYRWWATMRLRTMEEWISIWALPEMHAGAPEL